MALLCAFSVGSFAQSGQMVNLSNNTGLPDTTTNAATTYLTAKVSTPGTLTVQLSATKVSGTVAGSASLQASIDGANTPGNWFAVPGTDTLTFTDGNNSKVWTVSSNALAYRIRYVTTGTNKTAPKGFYLIRKHF